MIPDLRSGCDLSCLKVEEHQIICNEQNKIGTNRTKWQECMSGKGSVKKRSDQNNRSSRIRSRRLNQYEIALHKCTARSKEVSLMK